MKIPTYYGPEAANLRSCEPEELIELNVDPSVVSKLVEFCPEGQRLFKKWRKEFPDKCKNLDFDSAEWKADNEHFAAYVARRGLPL